MPQDFILALCLAACQQSSLGVSVGNWLKTNLHPPASLVHGKAEQPRVQHKDQKGLLHAEGGFGLLKLVLTGLLVVSSGRYTRLYLEELRCSMSVCDSQNAPNSSCTDPNEEWVNCAMEQGHFKPLIP